MPSWVRSLVRAVGLTLPFVIGALYFLNARHFRADDSVAAQIIAVVLAFVSGGALWWRCSPSGTVRAASPRPRQSPWR